MKMQIFEFLIHTSQQGALGPWNGPMMMMWTISSSCPLHSQQAFVTDSKWVNIWKISWKLEHWKSALCSTFYCKLIGLPGTGLCCQKKSIFIWNLQESQASVKLEGFKVMGMELDLLFAQLFSHQWNQNYPFPRCWLHSSELQGKHKTTKIIWLTWCDQATYKTNKPNPQQNVYNEYMKRLFLFLFFYLIFTSLSPWPSFKV